jgi:hypothetical protein
MGPGALGELKPGANEGAA